MIIEGMAGVKVLSLVHANMIDTSADSARSEAAAQLDLVPSA